jgi:hypothetical protein
MGASAPRVVSAMDQRLAVVLTVASDQRGRLAAVGTNEYRATSRL